MKVAVVGLTVATLSGFGAGQALAGGRKTTTPKPVTATTQNPVAVPNEPPAVEYQVQSWDPEGYVRFLEDVRREFSGGEVSGDASQTEQVGRVRTIRLLPGEDDAGIDLVVRSSDLYVLGWRWASAGVHGVLYALNGSNLDGSTPARIAGNYDSLPRRDGVSLGGEQLNDAIRTLMRHDGRGDNQRAQEAITRMIQMVSEAARFRPIQRFLEQHWTDSAPAAPWVQQMENNWGHLSQVLGYFGQQRRTQPNNHGTAYYNYTDEHGNAVSEEVSQLLALGNRSDVDKGMGLFSRREVERLSSMGPQSIQPLQDALRIRNSNISLDRVTESPRGSESGHVLADDGTDTNHVDEPGPSGWSLAHNHRSDLKKREAGFRAQPAPVTDEQETGGKAVDARKAAVEAGAEREGAMVGRVGKPRVVNEVRGGEAPRGAGMQSKRVEPVGEDVRLTEGREAIRDRVSRRGETSSVIDGGSRVRRSVDSLPGPGRGGFPGVDSARSRDAHRVGSGDPFDRGMDPARRDGSTFARGTERDSADHRGERDRRFTDEA
ncbi:ribosome-inactivating family protein [Streptomyces sp. NPDC007205]|uniref:ribosome-inactivating family protein n=1 Tax=Streptomyces sp. NPDC007205 TaxID=3154316 RepID=UPI00340FE2C5